MIGYNCAIDYTSKGNKISILSIHDKNFYFSSETWKFISDKNTDFSFLYAQAIVLKQLHLRLLASFFIKFRKSNFKIKIFSNEKDAAIWLKEIRKVNSA